MVIKYFSRQKSLEENKSHYFGSTEEVTKKMISELKIMFPDINIKGFFVLQY